MGKVLEYSLFYTSIHCFDRRFLPEQMDKKLPDVLQALVIFVMAGCTHLGIF